MERNFVYHFDQLFYLSCGYHVNNSMPPMIMMIMIFGTTNNNTPANVEKKSNSDAVMILNGWMFEDISNGCTKKK